MITRSANTGSYLSLIATFSLAVMPAVVFGQESLPQKIVFPASTFGPVGAVESVGGVSLNGRAVQQREAIWGGELIEVGANTGARVQLHAAGQVTLPAGARARLAVTVDRRDARAVLIASLVSGSMVVTLQPEAGAYVEAGRSAFMASEGASFRLTARDNKAVLAVAGGTVREEITIPQQKFLITPVGINRSFTRTKTNSGAAPIQVKITRPKRSGGPSVPGESVTMISFADAPNAQGQNQEPVEDTPVSFVLTPSTLGTVTPPITKTDKDGIARASFLAGSRTGKGKLRITAEETGDYLEWDIQVMSPIWFWTVQHKALVAVGAAAAVAVPTVVVATRDDNQIRPILPPVITP